MTDLVPSPRHRTESPCAHAGRLLREGRVLSRPGPGSRPEAVLQRLLPTDRPRARTLALGGTHWNENFSQSVDKSMDAGWEPTGRGGLRRTGIAQGQSTAQMRRRLVARLHRPVRIGWHQKLGLPQCPYVVRWSAETPLGSVRIH